VNVIALARGVQSTTIHTFAYMEQLVDNAETQIQQIARAATEVNNMATSSLQVAERARVLSNVALEARQVAEKGRTSVQRTVEEMDHITNNVHLTTEKVLVLGDRSREIYNIVEVISGIAQQTNRLALDAAIQAATAGAQGTGFGAVAADIRRLAERSKEQTVMISKIVQSVLEDINTAALSSQETEREVATGTALTQEVGVALDSIFSVVERQAREIEATNQVASQQMQSTKTVEQIMKQVSDSTQQSSAMTHQATKQMKTLAQIAGQLLTSVDIFKLREDRRAPAAVPENGQAANPQARRNFSSPLRPAPSLTRTVNSEPGFSGPNTPMPPTASNFSKRYQNRISQGLDSSPDQRK
jgi:methyl-accepting chemotaxis protein